MAGVDESGSSSIRRGLATLHFWIFDFPQLEAFRRSADDVVDSDEARFAQFNDSDVASEIVEIAKEICDSEIVSLSSPSPSSSSSPPTAREPVPASASRSWAAVRDVLRDAGLAVEGRFDDDDDLGTVVAVGYETRERRYYGILRALLCHALSDGCGRQRDYVGRIMAIGRPDIQQEIMKILQENNAKSNEEEDNNETGDYSAFAGSVSASFEASFAYESDNDNDMKRDVSEAFGEAHLDSDQSDSPYGKKRHHSDGKATSFAEKVDEHAMKQQYFAKEDDLRATITKLHEQLKESRQQEMDLTLKVDEEQSLHRAEMLQLESKHLTTVRDIEEKYAHEISEQKRETEALRDREQSAKDLKEENSRLRDDLDVLECSKEKLAYSEEQLRKCRERVELMGDAHDALQREEKAHAASVDKCLVLENELAQLKPLKRQLEEYRVRATDAEVALAECRDDLRRVKEKSSGLEGANRALKRGAHLQQAEAGNLQKQLQAQGGKSGGTAVGVGMSELNPELMEELKMLRSEYSRLKEFESKREVDSVQRLEESCDDAKRLSERYKEQFFQTKSELEDTQQLLCESKAREAKLRQEVEDWSNKCKELGEGMKDERLKSHRAALEAERNFQKQKKSLIDKGRQDLRELEEKLTLKIESERKQHKEKKDRAEARRVEIENNFSEQLTALREQTSKTLRSAKELEQKRTDELEQSKRAEIEQVKKEKADEIEALITKGKGMVREARRATKDLKRQITEEYEVQIRSLENDLDRVKEIQEDYEKKATAKISKRDRHIQLLEAKNSASMRANDELEEKAKKAERNSKDLVGENDRLRRQLGSRFGPGGATQNQMEELASVCKSLREENRRLKASNPDGLLLTRDRPPEPSPRNCDSNHETVSSFSKSALTQFREEYEERIEALEDEKRDLVMKGSAAATETQKAEQRSWELEEELEKVRSELTATKLALQRNERRSDFSAGLSASSKKRYERNEYNNKENTPNFRNRALPPSGAKRQDFTPIFTEVTNPKKIDAPKTLMELTALKDDGGAPVAAPGEQCQQS